jgi:hypothetical protein
MVGLSALAKARKSKNPQKALSCKLLNTIITYPNNPKADGPEEPASPPSTFQTQNGGEALPKDPFL